MNYIGIDISKHSFKVAMRSGKSFKTLDYENSKKGVLRFMKTLSKEDDHCVMEATGNYSYELLYGLNKANYRVSMMNPKQVKYFACALLSVAKTDKMDAQILVLYGEKMEPPVYVVPLDSILLLKQKRVVLRQLKKQLAMVRNLIESISVLPLIDNEMMNELVETEVFIDAKVNRIEREMLSLTQERYEEMMALLTSIKGIGSLLAANLIIVTNGFEGFDNAKQVSRYLGLCPTIKQSGTSLNIKGRINKNGDSHLRSQIYMGTWSAIKYNTACREFYEHLRREGKPGKVALIAVGNKLLRQAFAVVKLNRPYIDGYISIKPTNGGDNQKNIA